MTVSNLSNGKVNQHQCKYASSSAASHGLTLYEVQHLALEKHSVPKLLGFFPNTDMPRKILKNFSSSGNTRTKKRENSAKRNHLAKQRTRAQLASCVMRD